MMYAIVVGLQLAGQPIEKVKFQEMFRGSLEEIKKHGPAVYGERELSKHSIFSMPDEYIINSVLSSGEKTRSLFVTGEGKRVMHYVDGVEMSWREYESLQIEYDEAGEYQNHKFEEKHLPSLGLRMRIIEVE